MDKNLVRISMLLEIYGGLLTEKQRISMDLYYNNDFSLAEIAEESGISRQAVNENINKAKEKLEDFEKALNIYEKYSLRDNIIDQSLDIIMNINTEDTSNEVKEAVSKLETKLNELKNI